MKKGDKATVGQPECRWGREPRATERLPTVKLAKGPEIMHQRKSRMAYQANRRPTSSHIYTHNTHRHTHITQTGIHTTHTCKLHTGTYTHTCIHTTHRHTHIPTTHTHTHTLDLLAPTVLLPSVKNTYRTMPKEYFLQETDVLPKPQTVVGLDQNSAIHVCMSVY